MAKIEVSFGEFRNFVTGELAGVTSATRLPDQKCVMVMLKAKAGNPTNVYIGGSNVTVADGSTDVTTGFQLDAGDTTPWLIVNNMNMFYRICDSVDDGMTYMAVW